CHIKSSARAPGTWIDSQLEAHRNRLGGGERFRSHRGLSKRDANLLYFLNNWPKCMRENLLCFLMYDE
ncbi:MAG: hypothetical protein VXW00_14785, partial [Candidatus Latescibacterota bacterium]|nr:hypothetical protein [Candidatus Latescibacterota bacterium]